MNAHADKTQENKSQSSSSAVSQMSSSSESTFQFIDNRPETVAQRKIQEMVNNSLQVKQANQLQAIADNYSAKQQQPIQRRENTTEESERAKPRWGKIHAEVEKSGKFNSDETRANVKAYLKEHPEQANMINSAGGAWLANQMNLKEEGDRAHIGPTEAYMGKKEDESSAHAKHLEKFANGGHAFIVHWAHLKVLGMDKDWNFDGWGKDANFIGTPSAAQKLVEIASEPGGYGLYQLEKSLGVADGDWVGKCEPIGYAIWRYHVNNPDALNIRMASGAESQAYSPWYDKEGKFREGEWVPKGETLGGADEAVIDSLPRDKFFQAVAKGHIRIELESSMKENTEREKKEQKRPWKT